MGTIASVSVLSISTYQLHLHGDHTSLLHEVWLTANIKQNLFVSCYIAYVNLSTILSRFSIHFFFYETMPRLFLGILLYGIGSLVDNFNGFPYDYYHRLCKMAC